MVYLSESLEGDDPVSFFSTFLPKLLDMPTTTPLSIQRAHRLGPRPSLSTAPVKSRGVIILFLKFTDLLSVLSAARAKRQVSWLGQKVFLSQDVSNATASRRKEFLNLKSSSPCNWCQIWLISSMHLQSDLSEPNMDFSRTW